MSAWKMAQLQQFAPERAELPQLLLIKSQPTVMEQIFPAGRRSPVQRVRDLSAACTLARQILAEAEARLEREMDKTRGALEGLQEPTCGLVAEAFELTCEGLEQHFGALELLAAALDGEECDLDEAVRQAEQADQLLDYAERCCQAA